MARRKRPFLDDGESSDSGSDGASASDGMMDDEDQYSSRRRRRRKGGGKEDAIYGIFGSNDEEGNTREDRRGKTHRRRSANGRKIDYTRGQAFVSASAMDANSREVERQNIKEEGENNEIESSRSSESESEAEVDEDEDVIEARSQAERPKAEEPEIGSRPGLGSVRPQDSAESKEPRRGLGNSAFAQMFAKGGIGSSASNVAISSDASSSSKKSQFPVFAKATNATTSASIGPDKTAVVDNLADDRSDKPRFPQANAATINVSSKPAGGSRGKFDPSKYLASMGWSGGGLGKQGEGIVNPIEVKQRPERAGIAFGGRKEKTKQAKEEARRRGEDVSSDEDGQSKRVEGKRERRKAKHDVPTERAWTKREAKPRKPKIAHRTYEQILEERGHSVPGVIASDTVVDAAGNTYSSISAALAKHPVPSTEVTQLIEITHNLQIICDANTAQLDALASEGARILERHKWLQRDRDESLRRKTKSIAESDRASTLLKSVNEIESLGKRSQSDLAIDLSAFESLLLPLLDAFSIPDDKKHLQEVVIASLIPAFKREMSTWDPLAEPKRATQILHMLKGILKSDQASEVMTPYETMLWNIWMPPVRSAVNNDWDVYQSDAMVALLQAWSPLLPPFIYDNVQLQLILPKLRAAVSDWNREVPLYKIVFPWMPVLDRRMDDVVSEAKRRLRSSLKSWRVAQGPPGELQHWQGVLSRKEWDSMLLHHVVDKLSTYLQKNFFIDPQAQQLEPLDKVMAWQPLLAPKIMSKLLLARFLPQWLNTLYTWLKSPTVNFENVASWYEHWKSYFEARSAYSLESIQAGFAQALQMMDAAISLGNDRSALAPPDLESLQRHGRVTNDEKHQPAMTTTAGLATDDTRQELTTFRQIIDDAAAAADLLVLPLNRTEVRSGMPLFRLARNIDGKRGSTFFLDDDVCFAEQRGEESSQLRYVPVSVEELVASAK